MHKTGMVALALYNCLTSTGAITTVPFGQVLNFIAPNQYGGLAYFWTTGTPDLDNQ